MEDMKHFLPLVDPGADWPPELDHISASSINMFRRCPEQWRHRYILKEISPPSGALIQGKADHHAIETSFLHKIDAGVDLPVDDVREQFAVRFEEEVDWAGGYGEVKWDRQATTLKEQKRVAGRIKDDGIELVSMYRTEVAPLVWPEVVEKEFTFRPAGVPVDVQGRIDLIASDFNPMTQQVDGNRKMIERKTVGRNMVSSEWKLQANIYQLVEQEPLDFHLSLKSGKMLWGTPEFRVETTPEQRHLTAQMLQQAVMGIASMYRTFGPDQPWPDALNHTWACNYCGWREVCHWHTNM